MKIWKILALITFPLAASAGPVTYQFNGHITNLLDSSVGIPDSEYLGFVDWWPSVGDSYSGVMTYDEDTLIFDEAVCIVGPVCGGVVNFEMTLGTKVITLDDYGPLGFQSNGGLNFTAWLQVEDEFDSFRFYAGSFRGIGGSVYDHIEGRADSFARVSEPFSLPLLIFSIMVLGYARFRRAVPASQLGVNVHPS